MKSPPTERAGQTSRRQSPPRQSNRCLMRAKAMAADDGTSVTRQRLEQTRARVWRGLVEQATEQEVLGQRVVVGDQRARADERVDLVVGDPTQAVDPGDPRVD